MARITKTIWTYSALAKKAMALRDSDPQAFNRLVDGGSVSFLPGLTTHWHLGARQSHFDMSVVLTTKSGQTKRLTLFSVFGNRRGDKWYTHYIVRVQPGLFPKTMLQQYAPISLPDGVRCSREWKAELTKCVYHRVDGSIVHVGKWIGGKVRRSGTPDRMIVLDDQTGDVVSPDDARKGRLTSGYQNGPYDLGWNPYQSKTRLDWVNSIKSMPGINERATLECALRACKAAMEVVAEHPSIGMMLMPAEEWSSQFPMELPGGDTAIGLRLGFGKWQPPRVVLYWHEYYEEVDGEAHWSTLCMTIPPHGHPSLDPTGKSSPFARVRGDDVLAYHNLVAWKPGNNLARSRRFEPALSNPVLKYGEDHEASKYEEASVFWPENTDKVVAVLTTDADNPLMPQGIPYAMRPSDVGALVEGRFVSDSLPML